MVRRRGFVIASEGDLVVERDPDRPSGRLLRQDDMEASYVDLGDPSYLAFDYLRWARLLLRAFAARAVLHVGGAACALARSLLAADPGSRQEVFELDPLVLDIARAHLGLRQQPGFKVRVADGRAALAERVGGADAIVIDAFIGARVPRHLVTVEAFRMYARIAPLVLVNVIDTPGLPDVRAVAGGLGDAYEHVGALSGGRRGNLIVFGAAVLPNYAVIEGAAAADPAPARLLRADELRGSPWRDQPS
jgi:hypothetical protein